MLNFVSTKNLVLNSNCWALWATSFYKNVYTYFCQEGIHQCTANKYRAETLINASRFINKFDHRHTKTA